MKRPPAPVPPTIELAAARPRARAFGLALLACLAAGSPAPASAAALAPWERSQGTALPAGECRELRLGQVGQGLLELRFFTETLPTPSGPDLKSRGASLLIAAEDPTRVSLQVYAPGGVFERSSRVEPPLRWMRAGSDLCVASGARVVTCARVAGEIVGSLSIPFGEGWDATITGCPPFAIEGVARRAWAPWIAALLALASLALARSRRLADVAVAGITAASFALAALADADPWRLPHLALLPAAAAGAVLAAVASAFGRRRSLAERALRVALAILAALAVAEARHPVSTAAPVEPAAPALWRDAAHWHPRAAHQSLELRGRPLASVGTAPETWIVLGGSVVFGEGVAAEQAFPAVAGDLLRAERDAVVLNAGAQGWNVANVDRVLADLLDALPITGIVIASILNNATLPIAGPEPPGCDASLARAYLCNALRNQLVLPWPKALLPKPANPERHRRTLRALLERERRLGRRIVLLDEIAASDGSALAPWRTDEYRATTRSLAAENSAAFVEIDDAIAPLAPAERFLDGVHPTPAMHLLLGRRLYEVLRAQPSPAPSD